MKDTLVLLLLLSVLALSLVGGGFFFGRRYQVGLDAKAFSALKSAIPGQMDLLCKECWEVGKKVGLQTCDDMVDEFNSKGRY